jgi:hypothetical protein
MPKMRGLKTTHKAKTHLSLAIAFGIFFIGLLAFFSNLLSQSFNSDDVAEQSMAHNLLTLSPHSLQVQIDTYIMKYPIYWLFGLLTHPSVTQVALESFLLNLLMIILLWIWWRKYGPDFPIKWLVFAWLLACGTYWMAQTVNPNTRNIEIPLMLLLGCFASKYMENLTKYKYKLSWRVVLVTVGLGIISGLLVYNDPYVLFFILLPLSLATLIYAGGKENLWPVIFVTFWLAISLVVYSFLKMVASHYGINVTQFNEINGLSSSVVTLGYVPTKVIRTLEAYLSLFGINTTGVLLSPGRFLAGLPGVSAVLLAIWALYNIIRKRIFSLFNLWIILVIIFAFFYVIIAGTILSNTLRYLIILVPLTALLAANGLIDLKRQGSRFYKKAVWLISLSLLCSSIIAIVNLSERSQGPRTEKTSYSLIEVLRYNRVENVYADYWMANITYYLSGYQDNVLPTVCYYGKVYKDPVLLDSERFDFSGGRTGVLVTPSLIAPTDKAYPQSPSCTVSASMSQFGKPQKIVRIAPSVTLLIYSHTPSVAWRPTKVVQI